MRNLKVPVAPVISQRGKQRAWQTNSPLKISRKLLGGLEHLDYDFPYIGNVIIPTDELILFRGVGIPPTRKPQRSHCVPCLRPVSKPPPRRAHSSGGTCVAVSIGWWAQAPQMWIWKVLQYALHVNIVNVVLGMYISKRTSICSYALNTSANLSLNTYMHIQYMRVYHMSYDCHMSVG